VEDGFLNSYADDARADSYATLQFPGTYSLAFRDLPWLIEKHASGKTAVDFGCGAGRSTRFLRGLGFEVVGLDISAEMVARARELDPQGDYRIAEGSDLAGLAAESADLVLSAFTFDNVPHSEKPALFGALRRLLRPSGRIVNLVSTPEIYTHEWTSFTTQDFPSNRSAKCGDSVFTVMLDVEDRRPVTDVFCPHEDYLALYREAGLRVVDSHKPLGNEDDPIAWVNETRVAPWIVYVLGLGDD
jgi:trans-aconitate methyltransferase